MDEPLKTFLIYNFLVNYTRPIPFFVVFFWYSGMFHSHFYSFN